MQRRLMHSKPVQTLEKDIKGVPRWPAAVALVTIGLIYLFLSQRYTIGPRWLPLAVILAFLIPINLSRWRGHLRITRRLVLLVMALVTGSVAGSAASLVIRLTIGRTNAVGLLLDAALIWVSNVLVFALWYWEIDAGGPAERHLTGHCSTDFIFPQMTQEHLAPGWSPAFLDYLFLAFNTSTAFSPTDTMVLSRRAKVLMMTQSLISLVVIAVLAARAINTL